MIRATKIAFRVLALDPRGQPSDERLSKHSTEFIALNQEAFVSLFRLKVNVMKGKKNFSSSSG
jgi:hypothetical protein